MPSQHLRNLVRDLTSKDGGSSNMTHGINIITTRAVGGIENYEDSVAHDPNAYDNTPMRTTRSVGYNAMIMILFVLFMLMTLCLITMRLASYYQQRNGHAEQQGPEDHHHHNVSENDVVRRSKEDIEHMLVLKKVMLVGEPNNADDVGKGQPEVFRIKKLIGRRKSNLILPAAAVTGDELDQSRSCSICLCEYKNGENICWSNNNECFHRFHADCGVAWLAKHSQCPVCRAEYLVAAAPCDEKAESKTGETTAAVLGVPVSSVRTHSSIVIAEDGEEAVSVEEGGNNIAGDATERMQDAEETI